MPIVRWREAGQEEAREKTDSAEDSDSETSLTDQRILLAPEWPSAFTVQSPLTKDSKCFSLLSYLQEACRVHLAWLAV